MQTEHWRKSVQLGACIFYCGRSVWVRGEPREGGGGGVLTAGIKRLCNVAAYWRVSHTKHTRPVFWKQDEKETRGLEHPLSPVLDSAGLSGGEGGNAQLRRVSSDTHSLSLPLQNIHTNKTRANASRDSLSLSLSDSSRFSQRVRLVRPTQLTSRKPLAAQILPQTATFTPNVRRSLSHRPFSAHPDFLWSQGSFLLMASILLEQDPVPSSGFYSLSSRLHSQITDGERRCAAAQRVRRRCCVRLQDRDVFSGNIYT